MTLTPTAYNSNTKNISFPYSESYENASSTKKIKIKPSKVPFSPSKSLLSEKIDSSSSTIDSLSYLFNIGTETFFAEEFSEEFKVLCKISYFIDEIIQKEKININKTKEEILNDISEILKEIPVEKMEISDEELHKRIKKIIAVESIAGMLNELTSEQRIIFEEEIKRRPLFK